MIHSCKTCIHTHTQRGMGQVLVSLLLCNWNGKQSLTHCVPNPRDGAETEQSSSGDSLGIGDKAIYRWHLGQGAISLADSSYSVCHGT